MTAFWCIVLIASYLAGYAYCVTHNINKLREHGLTPSGTFCVSICVVCLGWPLMQLGEVAVWCTDWLKGRL